MARNVPSPLIHYYTARSTFKSRGERDLVEWSGAGSSSSELEVKERSADHAPKGANCIKFTLLSKVFFQFDKHYM